nr:aldehyde dehydrogenase family protein [Bdellovibrionales bacterium]
LEALGQFADRLHQTKAELAKLMTAEMGKAIKESDAEIDKCVASVRALIEHFPHWRAEIEHKTGNGYEVTREPLGVIVGIMPWNFPLWEGVRFAAPTLLCGNAILLKHSTNTWGSAEFIDRIFNETLPAGAFRHLRVDHDVIGDLIADQRVRGVSLTGSRRAGVSVGERAGKHLKKCVLELGGSDAYVVLDDADVAQAATVSARSRVINAGQSCVSAKRFIVTRKNHSQFLEAFVAEMKKFKLGDPADPATDMGPLARRDLRDELDRQVQASVKAGAKVALSGGPQDGPGNFYAASVLGDVRPGQKAFDEELFGPAAAVIEAKDETDAFRLANLSRYGLGGAVFSKDVERAHSLARLEFDTGMIAINDFVRSDVLAPFGGVRDSGLGRELGRDGCFEFTNIKSIFTPKSR